MSNTTSRYINPLLDFSFKKIFGTDPNKDLLIAFLNEIFKGRKHIVNLVYNKNEHHGDHKEEGLAVFDLLCTGDQGEKFMIEVQHSSAVNFKKRGLYYTSRLISEQAPRGQSRLWRYNITEVYFVAILEKLEEDVIVNDRYLHDICLCYRDTGEIFYDELGYTYIDLASFVKTKEELKTELDVWLHSLKHLSEMDDVPLHLRKTIFEKLYNIAEYSNMSKEEQKMYNQDLKRKWDNEAALAFREERGELKGELKGRIEGELKRNIEIVRNMKDKNFSTEVIAEITGLSIEEINEL